MAVVGGKIGPTAPNVRSMRHLFYYRIGLEIENSISVNRIDANSWFKTSQIVHMGLVLAWLFG